MKYSKLLLLSALVLISSCGTQEQKRKEGSGSETSGMVIPIDKGFSQYISGYTSGVIPVNAPIEIRFTPEFAEKADRNKLSGIFSFEPSIKGKAEWSDNLTMVYRPAKMLDPGTTYQGSLHLNKIGEVESRLKSFPIQIQTLRKDFSVNIKNIEYAPEGDSYNLGGEIIASDYIDPGEVESYIRAEIGKKDLNLSWDHSSPDFVHSFRIEKIAQADDEQEVVFYWDGTLYGVKQKASAKVKIPRKNDFSIQKINVISGETPRVDIVLSEPPDPAQDLNGLIWFTPVVECALQVNSNTISVFPATTVTGAVELTIEASLKSSKGVSLTSSRRENIEFTSVLPGITAVGKGVILPASGSLVFPFMSANLKAVDIKIIKIFENNLPYFLQDNNLDEGGYIKRFGRPVYAGRVDLMTGSSGNSGKWSLHTIDLSDYITVEPGVLYKVQLSMRKSYSLYSCGDDQGPSKYEQMLNQSELQMREWWDDPENYYGDFESSLFYNYGYDWRQRSDPCKEAYYSPDKSLSRNLLASNLGILAKMGEDKRMVVFVNDIRTTEPVPDATVDVIDLQMQTINSAKTSQDGSAVIDCKTKPFLIIVRKGTDRNYLKTNDGSSLSLSSFDVSGVTPENGIKTYIYGERDVWRPGDSIYLSVIIRDMKKELPEGHPVQFELINPQEQKIDNQVQSLPSSGLLVFRTRTGDNMVTGNYTAVIRVGGATFTKRVRVETVKPNRLKIELNFANEVLGSTGGKESAQMAVKWLNGATAKNLKAAVDLLLKPAKTTFAKYPQYTFDDPASSFSSETINIFDGSVDEKGNAVVNFYPDEKSNAPGMLNALFTARVFEKGGDASIIQKSYKYAPFRHFVGINFPGLSGKNRMLYTDASNEIKLVTVDQNGKQVASTVEVNIYKISYRWWWEAGEENLGSYISGTNYKPVFTKKISTSAGEGSVTFTIPKNEWGRYLVRATASSGHTSGEVLLVDWPWEYGSKGTTDGATLLTVNTDKEKYNVGDNIQLSFPAPKNSKAIVTLENATGIIDQMIVNTTGSNSIVNLKAKSEMAPNVYAYVTLIQPHGQTSNDMPVRLYGVAPVMVEDASTRLNPLIFMPDEIRSQESFEVKVSEESRESMTYTLAIVDEGLLDITGFRTPDPWNYFYAREALGVKTWDLYDYVLGALGGTLDRALATGGDEALKDKSATKAKRFIPVVKFLGPFTLEAGRTNKHNVTLPLYTGSVKAMVIAGSEKAFGIADKQVLVRDPLMILATAPRVLSPGEKVSLPVTVFIQKDNIRKVTVEASGNDLIKFSSNRTDITANEQGEKDTNFEFTVSDKTGKAEITINAEGNGEKATYRMEVEVRSPNPPETRSELKVLKPGESYDKMFVPFGIEGTGSAVIEVSALPSINLDKNLDWLINYPHGCSEQVTSSVFPQLWLKQLYPDNSDMAARSSANISAAINILITRQMNNGGIALWPGSYQPDNWVTSYAGHFILEAEKLGYSVPSGFRQKWVKYQKSLAQSWRADPNYSYTATDQAYRLFTLALAGEADKGAMNRLRETKNLPRLSGWLLAAAFATSGRNEVAEQLIDVRTLTTEEDYYDYYYGGYLRDRSIILYTLTLLKKQEEALPLLKSLCDDLNRGSWYSTQTVAWGLFAYSRFAEMLPSDNSRANKITLTVNGEKKDLGFTGRMTAKENLKIKSGDNQVRVENKSDNPVYFTFIQKGIPLVSDVMREDKGLAMNVEYMNMEMQPINEKSMEQGADFAMVVKVTNNAFRRVDNIALTQMVPSGWEIQNTRLFEAVFGIKESAFDYRDFRDDRVYTYFSLNRGETKTFVVILNAAYKGEYFQPAIWCEAMYRENCYSRIPGKTVTVTGQKVE